MSRSRFESLTCFYYLLRRCTVALRADKQGPHRVAFDKNKARILKTQSVCGICGKPVDVRLKAPNPLAPAIDHIVPVSKGGHPSAMENLQLTHAQCNRQKSDKLFNSKQATAEPKVIGNRNLPQSRDWASYEGK
ncbi:HNH endonuclease signature motif containing protein [Lactococcus fujiensis]|uniref:HNH endonuclease signature motif containing protein n=1 Tax=Lactococcus fujiensis TaxID=610251 RepID=UPI000BDE7ED6